MKNGRVAGLLAVSLLAAPAFGGIVAFTAPNDLSLTGGDPVNLGMTFVVSSNISVDALGFYDIGNLSAAEPVALYNDSGHVLASTTVSPGVDISGYFFDAITPVILLAGHQYVVDALAANGNWAYGGSAPPTSAPGITYVSHQFVYTDVLKFPTFTAGAAATAYYGPNLEFTEILAPEPGTLYGLTVGMASLLFGVRRSAHSRKKRD
jgi:uncharacterized protein DUF4082